MKTATISTICPADPLTWSEKVFLTIDVDWAHDDIIIETAKILEAAGAAATWFITHDSPALDRIRRNPNFELGIHPNFNWLLLGDNRAGKNATDVVSKMMEIVPEAKSVRSHSMTQSSVLLNIFSSFGLTHDVNQFVPASIGDALSPWTLWNSMIRVPYFWEDDISCMLESNGQYEPFPANKTDTHKGLRVFDFHPIHIFLNTEALNRYEATRHLHQHPEKLLKHRFEGSGTRNKLAELLKNLI